MLVLRTKIEGDDDIGAERAQRFEFLRIAARHDHLCCSKCFRSLNGNKPRGSCCTVDEDSLSSLEAGAFYQRGEAGHAGIWQRGGDHIVEIVGQSESAARVDKG